ncbi:MAG: hypothetical protein M1831_004847 [Alyxoria varia]|nr:MAG: hypothetical protein M1831_004847 [Alyxoria varia]
MGTASSSLAQEGNNQQLVDSNFFNGTTFDAPEWSSGYTCMPGASNGVENKTLPGLIPQVENIQQWLRPAPGQCIVVAQQTVNANPPRPPSRRLARLVRRSGQSLHEAPIKSEAPPPYTAQISVCGTDQKDPGEMARISTVVQAVNDWTAKCGKDAGDDELLEGTQPLDTTYAGKGALVGKNQMYICVARTEIPQPQAPKAPVGR